MVTPQEIKAYYELETHIVSTILEIQRRFWTRLLDILKVLTPNSSANVCLLESSHQEIIKKVRDQVEKTIANTGKSLSPALFLEVVSSMIQSAWIEDTWGEQENIRKQVRMGILLLQTIAEEKTLGQFSADYTNFRKLIREGRNFIVRDGKGKKVLCTFKRPNEWDIQSVSASEFKRTWFFKTINAPVKIVRIDPKEGETEDFFYAIPMEE